MEILEACEKTRIIMAVWVKTIPRGYVPFVLVLRFTGLPIRDVVALESERLTGNKLFLFTAKTGVPVYCPPTHEEGPNGGGFGRKNPRSSRGLKVP
jgi:hypothetical protein